MYASVLVRHGKIGAQIKGLRRRKVWRDPLKASITFHSVYNKKYTLDTTKSCQEFFCEPMICAMDFMSNFSKVNINILLYIQQF